MWRQSQEQRILDTVKQSIEKRKTADPQASTYTFQRFKMSDLGPSALSPNPCRLLMSKFTSLGSAVSPHEMTGRRLKSTLIERFKSRSPNLYSFKKQQRQIPQSLTLTPSAHKSEIDLNSTLKNITFSDLDLASDLVSQKQTSSETIEELPNISPAFTQDQLKRFKLTSDAAYTAMACSTIKSNVARDLTDLSILDSTPTLASATRERLLMHMSREDIEQEALRSRFLEDAGLKKEKKYPPYVRLADKRHSDNISASGERMRVRRIITADSALAQKHQTEREKLLLSSSCIVRTVNPAPSENHVESKPRTRTGTVPPCPKGQAAISTPPTQAPAVAQTVLSDYISKQSQTELIATYQQASIKLREELHEKKRRCNDLQNSLRYLQILASIKLQPDRVPPGFYCYLNLPCCHYSIYSELHFSIGDLCVKCRQRIENCIMIKADIAQ